MSIQRSKSFMCSETLQFEAEHIVNQVDHLIYVFFIFADDFRNHTRTQYTSIYSGVSQLFLNKAAASRIGESWRTMKTLMMRYSLFQQDGDAHATANGVAP